MLNSPLLSNVRQRAMITPVSPPLARLIHIRRSCWTICRSFEIFSKWELSTGMNFKSNVLHKSIASKNIQPDLKHVLENT